MKQPGVGASAPDLRTLDEHVAALLSWLGNIREIPAYTSISVLDTSRSDVSCVTEGSLQFALPAAALVPVESFAPTFDGYLRCGYSWINLSVYGLFGTRLVLGLELPAYEGNVPQGFTSVNYSGPSERTRAASSTWQLDLRMT